MSTASSRFGLEGTEIANRQLSRMTWTQKNVLVGKWPDQYDLGAQTHKSVMGTPFQAFHITLSDEMKRKWRMTHERKKRLLNLSLHGSNNFISPRLRVSVWRCALRSDIHCLHGKWPKRLVDEHGLNQKQSWISGV
jgi:hypothetical protein